MRRYTLRVRGREIVVDVQERSADRFDVVVGGERYDVTIAGDRNVHGASVARSRSPAASPVPALPADTGALADAGVPPRSAAPRPTPVPPSPPPLPGRRGPGRGAATVLRTPMPGTILEVSVAVGDEVDRGQQIAVLDAMKMHNVIGAPRAGVVAEIYVEAGQAVASGVAIARFVDTPSA